MFQISRDFFFLSTQMLFLLQTNYKWEKVAKTVLAYSYKSLHWDAESFRSMIQLSQKLPMIEHYLSNYQLFVKFHLPKIW